MGTNETAAIAFESDGSGLAERIRAAIPRQVAKANERDALRYMARRDDVLGYVVATTAHLEPANGR